MTEHAPERDVLAARFEQARPMSRAVAHRLLGAASDAEDAVQDAWRRLSRVDAVGIDDVEGWLTTTVARICLDRLRARTRAARATLHRRVAPTIWHRRAPRATAACSAPGATMTGFFIRSGIGNLEPRSVKERRRGGASAAPFGAPARDATVAAAITTALTSGTAGPGGVADLDVEYQLPRRATVARALGVTRARVTKPCHRSVRAPRRVDPPVEPPRGAHADRHLRRFAIRASGACVGAALASRRALTPAVARRK